MKDRDSTVHALRPLPAHLLLLHAGRLREVRGLGEAFGWWNAVIPCDADGDGDTDLLAGNLGRNTRFEASPEAPLLLLAKDFDGNGQVDPVLFHTVEGAFRPVPQFDLIRMQLPYMSRRFGRYRDYARAELDQVFPAAERAGALELRCTTLDNTLFLNDGSGGFAAWPLPPEAQSFPVQDAVAADADFDGKTDLLLVGNFYHMEIETGPVSAGRGLVMIGDGAGGFRSLSPRESGFSVPGDARAAALADDGSGGRFLVVAVNDGEAVTFELAAPTSTGPVSHADP